MAIPCRGLAVRPFCPLNFAALEIQPAQQPEGFGAIERIQRDGMKEERLDV